VAVAAGPNDVAHGPLAVVADIDVEGVLAHDLCDGGDDLGLAVLCGEAQGGEEGADLGPVGAVRVGEVREGEADVGEGEGVGVQDELLDELGEGFRGEVVVGGCGL